MEEKTLNISLEKLAELKIEVDDLVNGLENIIETCDESLNS